MYANPLPALKEASFEKCKTYSTVNSDSSTYYCQSLLEHKNLSDSLRVWVLLYAGIAESVGGNYNQAAQYYYRSLPLADSLKMLQARMELLNSIGIDLYYQDRINESISIFEETIDLAQDLQDEKQLANSYMNVGMAKGEIGMPEEELEYYKKAEVIFKYIKDQSGYADVLMNQGTVYLTLANHGQALSAFNTAASIYKEKDNPIALIQLNQNYAELYLAMQQPQLSLEYAKTALEQSQTLALKQDELYSYKLLKEIYAFQGRYRMALKNMESFYALEKSILSEDRLGEIMRMEQAHEAQKKASEIQLLQANQKVDAIVNSRQRWMIGLMSSAALLLGFALLSYRRKSALQKELLQSEVLNLRTQIKNLIPDHHNISIEELNTMNSHASDPLTEREIEVLYYILQDYSNSEVASKVYLSVNTVKFHLKKIYSKLEVSSRSQVKKKISTQLKENQ